MYKNKKGMLSLLSIALISGSFGVVNCEDTVASDSEVACSGFYVGAGLSYQYTKGEAYLDDNLSVYVNNSDARGLKLCDAKVGKVGGVIDAGYGCFITGKAYAGIDLSLDIAGNTDKTRETYYGESKIKTRGIVPTIAVRFGGMIPKINLLTYARVGLAFADNKFSNDEVLGKSFSTSSVSPIVGLGVEKAINQKITAKFEVDYRFASDRKKSIYSLYQNGKEYTNRYRYQGEIKNKARGYAVRLMGAYHF